MENAQAFGQVGNNVQPKMWKDLTADEKVERLREQLKSSQMTVSYLQGQIGDLRSMIEYHKHLDGEVVRKITGSGLGAGLVGKSLNNPEREAKGEVYF